MNAPTRLTLLALMGATILMLTSPASADPIVSQPLTFCNQTPVQVGLAIGYHSPGVNDPADHSLLTGPFVSDGWYSVPAGQCQTFPNKFDARYMFWFAFSSQYNNDPVAAQSGNGQHMCVTNYFLSHANGMEPNFTYEAENVSPAACWQAGGRGVVVALSSTLSVHGQSVDTWVNATVNFAESAPFRSSADVPSSSPIRSNADVPSSSPSRSLGRANGEMLALDCTYDGPYLPMKGWVTKVWVDMGRSTVTTQLVLTHLVEPPETFSAQITAASISWVTALSYTYSVDRTTGTLVGVSNYNGSRSGTFQCVKGASPFPAPKS